MQKVLLVDPIAVEGIKLLEEYGLHVVFLEDNSRRIKENVVDADAILVRTSRITREIIEAGRRLKVIARHGVGVENIDWRPARRIHVTNTPLANTTSVAEHVIG